jgi:hypothetical protein
MARVADGSIRTATVADAPAIGFVHVEAWRETYVGIVPDHVLADLSVDRRAAMWGRILSDPSAPNASAAFVAERGGTIVGFGCCGLQRDEMLSAGGYGGEIKATLRLIGAVSHDQGRWSPLGPGSYVSFGRLRTLA